MTACCLPRQSKGPRTRASGGNNVDPRTPRDAFRRHIKPRHSSPGGGMAGVCPLPEPESRACLRYFLSDVTGRPPSEQEVHAH